MKLSSTRLLAHALAGSIKGASRLLDEGRRKKLLGHLHRLLMPVAKVKVGGHSLSLVVPDRGAAYWTQSGIDCEPETINWIGSFDRGSFFFDVGANVGLFSLYAAARQCTCVAIEPNPFSFDALVRNIAINRLEKAIIPLCVAVGIDHEIAKFGLASPEAGSVGNTLAEPEDQRFQIGTMVMSLDQMVAIKDMPFPNHLKIDVDGNEAAVLAGGAAILGDERLRSLLVEVAMMNDDRQQSLKSSLEGVGLMFSPPESSPQNWLFRRK